MNGLFSKWLTSNWPPSREVQKSGKKIIYGKQQSTTKNPWKRDSKFSILYCYPVKVQRASHSIPPRVWVRVCGLAYHVLDQLTSTTCVGAFVWHGLFLFFCLAIMLATFLLESLHIGRMVRVNVYRYHYFMRAERSELAEMRVRERKPTDYDRRQLNVNETKQIEIGNVVVIL